MADTKNEQQIQQVIPTDFIVKRVAPDAVLLQQDMVDEISTYVCYGNKGLIDKILYRFLSAIADQQPEGV